MKAFAVLVVAIALCCTGFADKRLQASDALDPLQAIDPSLDSLADAKADDRDKRQLSFVQGKLLNFLKPLPVVDVIKEEDKYGNNGGKFNRIGRGIIEGMESLSSKLSSALSLPMTAVKKLSRTATDALNNIGGRLVGLQ